MATEGIESKQGWCYVPVIPALDCRKFKANLVHVQVHVRQRYIARACLKKNEMENLNLDVLSAKIY